MSLLKIKFLLWDCLQVIIIKLETWSCNKCSVGVSSDKLKMTGVWICPVMVVKNRLRRNTVELWSTYFRCSELKNQISIIMLSW